MELVWKQLLHSMTQLSASCHTLAGLALLQRDAIVHEQIQKLGELVIEQEQEMVNFQAWEQERVALLGEVGKEFGQTYETLDLAKVLPALPEAWGSDYRQLRDELRTRMEAVKRENEVNRALLNQSQRFVSWLLNYLVTPAGAAPIYDAAGTRTQRSYYHIVNQSM